MTFVRGDDTPGGLQVKHRQRRLDRRPHSARRVLLQHRRPDDALVERPLGLDAASRRGAAAGRGAAPTASRWCSFTNPNPDAVIRCLESCVRPGETAKYPPITVSEHYLGKLMKAGHSRVDAKADDALAEAKPHAAQIARPAQGVAGS